MVFVRQPLLTDLRRYYYLRSTDGGQSWNGGSGDITVSGGRRVEAHGLRSIHQPTVAGDEPLYIAYMHNDTTIRFLSGVDDNINNKVDFAYLMDDQQRPAKVHDFGSKTTCWRQNSGPIARNMP